MSIFDKKRLTNETFKLDIERIDREIQDILDRDPA